MTASTQRHHPNSLKRHSTFAALTLTVLAAFIPVAKASTASTSSTERDRIAEIDQLLTQTYPSTAPGAAVIISRDGKPLLKKTYGLANLETNTPLQMSDVMRIASVTKPFTAMAIMLLEEDGKLSLQDDITRHLPGYPTHGHKITIAHLLAHTSGIGVYTESPKLREMIRPATTTSEVLNFIKTIPPLTAPGEVWNYNNSGYYLLGTIIEKVSGMPYAEFLAKRIFSPLQMSATFVEGAPGAKPVIPNYRAQDGRFSIAPPMNPVVAFSAGAIVSTPEDIERWLVAVESRKLLRPASWQRVMTAAPLNNAPNATYGFGWTLRKLRGQTLIEHSGNTTGFQAQVMMLPQDKLSFIVMTNQQQRGNIVRHNTERIAAMMIGRPLVAHKAIEVSEAVLDEFVGTYEMKGATPRTMTRDGKRLRMALVTTPGSAQSFLQAYADDAFFPTELSFNRFRFVRDATRGVTQMIRIDVGDEEQVFARVANAPK